MGSVFFMRPRRMMPVKSWDFLGGVLPEGLTFARASKKCVFNAAGTLVEVADNVPGFEYDPVTLSCQGLSVEGQRTNLISNSTALTSGWSGSAVKADNAVVSPMGTQNAGTLTVASGSAGVYRFLSVTASQTYTISAYLKLVSGSATTIQFGTDSIAGLININPATMSVTSAQAAVTGYAIAPCGNGWYRASVTVTATGSSLSFVVFCVSCTSMVLGVFGAQMEAGESVSSYIQTSGSAATRAADTCSIAAGAWFNASEGSVVVDCVKAVGDAATVSYIEFNDQSANNRFGVEGAGASVNALLVSGGVTKGSRTMTATLARKTLAVAFKVGRFAMAMNGGLTGSVAPDAVPSGVSQMNIGSKAVPAATAHAFARVRRVKYWNVALGDAQLQRETV